MNTNLSYESFVPISNPSESLSVIVRFRLSKTKTNRDSHKYKYHRTEQQMWRDKHDHQSLSTERIEKNIVQKYDMCLCLFFLGGGVGSYVEE